MNLSTRFLAAALALAAFTVGASAEESGEAKERRPPRSERGERGQGPGMVDPERRVEAIDRAVGGLTEEQKGKIREILAAAREEMQVARDSGAMREKGRAIMEKSREQIRTVLTDDQKTKFDERAEQRPEGERKRGPRPQK